MEEYTIVTQGSATYLERTLGADELLDEVDRGMLVSNQISGVLPLNIQWINADCRLLYNITGLTPLVQAARILEHETRLSNFFMALCRAEKECDEYLLDPHKIAFYVHAQCCVGLIQIKFGVNARQLLRDRCIIDQILLGRFHFDQVRKAFDQILFVPDQHHNKHTSAVGHAYVMYVPVQAALDKYTPTELAGYVLRMIGRQMSHDSRVISVLSRQLLYGEKFSFVDLEKQIEEIPTQAEPSKAAYEPKPPVSEPPVRQSEAGGASLRPEPVMYKPEPAPAHVPAEQPVQDSPFAAQQGGNPFIASQPEPQPKKEQKDEKAEKAKKKSEKEKKSGGLFGGLFGGKKDKKKHTTEEQDNPFRQEAPAPKQSADKPAPAAAAYVPPQPPVQQAGGHTVVLAAGNGGTARTTLMEAGSSGGVGELYLVQKATNQYIHVTHTNFHIGRAEDVVDYTVHTQNCYLGNDHAYILIENGNYYIVDNNTQNHTYLNEQRLEPSKPTQFHAGDTIRMADIVFSVVAGA